MYYLLLLPLVCQFCTPTVVDSSGTHARGGYHLPCSTFQPVSSTFSLCNTDSFFFNSSPLFDSFFPTLPPPSHCHLRHCVFHLLPPPQLFIHAIRYSVSSSSFSLTVFLALIHMVPPASFSFLMYFSIQCRRLQKAQLVQVCTSKTPFLPQLQLWGLVLLHQLSFSSPIIIITSIFTHLFVETTSEKRNLFELYESQLLNHLLFCSSSVLFPARPLKCVYESEVDFYSSGSSTQKINK